MPDRRLRNIPQMMQRRIGIYQPAGPVGMMDPLYRPQPERPFLPGMGETRERKMTVDRLKRANETLNKYKAGKAAQDERVVENEKWYRMRHWEMIQGNDGDQDPRYKTKTAWLFNSLNILHSDAMDAYPRLNVLPKIGRASCRERV